MREFNVVRTQLVTPDTTATVVYAETPWWWEVKCEGCPEPLISAKRLWRPLEPGNGADDAPFELVEQTAPAARECSHRVSTHFRAWTVAVNSQGAHNEVRVVDYRDGSFGVSLGGWRVGDYKTEAGAMRRAMKELAVVEAAP